MSGFRMLRAAVLSTLCAAATFADAATVARDTNRLDGVSLPNRLPNPDAVSPGAASEWKLAANLAADVTGVYESVITSRRGKRRSVVKLVQTGNEVIGTWEDKPDFRIVGTRNGDTIVFEWFNPRAGYDLVGKWKIIASEDRLEGLWERPDGKPGGKWALTRIE